MSDASPAPPTTLSECHARLAEQQALIDSQQATIEQQQTTIDDQQALLQTLQRDIALMKRTLFGQRRERFEDPRQGLLFASTAIGELEQGDNLGPDDNLDQNSSASDTSDEDEGKSPSGRRGRVSRVIPECLPRTQRIHKLDDAEIPDDLQGEDIRRFLKKVGEYIEWEPPRLIVVEETLGI